MSKKEFLTCLFTLMIASSWFSIYAEASATSIDQLKQKTWFGGAKDCLSDQSPEIEVYQYNLDTYILRQNKCIHYEAPFIYLLFGENRTLLIDTGATKDSKKFPLAEKVHETWEQQGR